MKILKIKSLFLVLIAMLTVSIFMVSCEKEDLTTNTEILSNELLDESYETYRIEIPQNIAKEEALDWARNVPISEYEKIENMPETDLMERGKWCSFWYLSEDILYPSECYCYHYTHGWGNWCSKRRITNRRDCVVWGTNNYSYSEFRTTINCLD